MAEDKRRFHWEDVQVIRQQILDLLGDEVDGLADKEIAQKLGEQGLQSNYAATVCSQLAYEGRIDRFKNKGAQIRNRITGPETNMLSIKSSEGLEKLVLSVLSEDEGLSNVQILERINRKGISKILINEICKQLDQKGKIRRVPGNPYWHYLK